MTSVACQWMREDSAHLRYHDLSAAAEIFANSAYFLNMLRNCVWCWFVSSHEYPSNSLKGVVCTGELGLTRPILRNTFVILEIYWKADVDLWLGVSYWITVINKFVCVRACAPAHACPPPPPPPPRPHGHNWASSGGISLWNLMWEV
jgi:hypothetical protein